MINSLTPIKTRKKKNLKQLWYQIMKTTSWTTVILHINLNNQHSTIVNISFQTWKFTAKKQKKKTHVVCDAHCHFLKHATYLAVYFRSTYIYI